MSKLETTDAAPMTRMGFIAIASSIAERASNWAGDAARHPGPDEAGEPFPKEAATRFIGHIERLLNYIRDETA